MVIVSGPTASYVRMRGPKEAEAEAEEEEAAAAAAAAVEATSVEVEAAVGWSYSAWSGREAGSDSARNANRCAASLTSRGCGTPDLNPP